MKSVDGVLGIWTLGCKMVGADETMELLNFMFYIFDNTFYFVSLFQLWILHSPAYFERFFIAVLYKKFNLTSNYLSLPNLQDPFHHLFHWHLHLIIPFFPSLRISLLANAIALSQHTVFFSIWTFQSHKFSTPVWPDGQVIYSIFGHLLQRDF